MNVIASLIFLQILIINFKSRPYVIHLLQVWHPKKSREAANINDE